MKLVWHDPGMWEADWIRHLFQDVVSVEIVDGKDSCFESDSIHVVNTFERSLVDYEPYFRELRQKANNITLLHGSDEWFSGPYRIYEYFDRVVRNHRTFMTDHEGILTIPLGYSAGTQMAHAPKIASDRKYIWSFAGEIKASRVEMTKAMATLSPAFLTDTASGKMPKLNKNEYNNLISESVFVPCPMGNVVAETFRLYEALDLGAIPIVERRPTIDYYTYLLGDNPLPCFAKWDEAHDWCKSLISDRSLLNQTQSKISDWWAGYRHETRDSITRFLSQPSSSVALVKFSKKYRNRSRITHQIYRMAELLRHQSTASLWRRLKNPLGPLRRIVNESLGRAKA